AGGGLPKVLDEAERELDAFLKVDYHKSFPLSWEDFSSAREVIEATFRRFDYDPFRGVITIRMTTPIHDSFAGLLNKAVAVKLFPLKNGDNTTARFVQNIVPLLTSRNYLDNRKQPRLPVLDPKKKEQKSPDLQYRHELAQYSGLVVEIAYTQPAKQLKKLAQAYIRGSMGRIKTKAKYTLEEDGSAILLDVQQDLNEVPFRSADRNPLNEDHELELCLHDMTANKSLLNGVRNEPIPIPFKDLCAFMDKVEKMQLETMEHPREAEQQHHIDGILVKLAEPPSSSPEDELASADERIFAKQEKAEEEKAKSGGGGVFHPVEADIKGHPNVLTRSALKKRAAPPGTGADLQVTKRRRRRG
ncbi:hypothetical protein FPANT_12303, partial [Fusarium pseudoanthophilum]